MTEGEIWKIAEKWGDTLRAVADKHPDGRLKDTSLGMTLTCTIRDAISEAVAAAALEMIDTIIDDLDGEMPVKQLQS